MDYSHGDPEASGTLNYNRSQHTDNRSTESYLKFSTEYAKELQPLSESMEVSDGEPDSTTLKQKYKSSHVSFQHSSTSIEDLRRESKTLLDQNRPKTPSAALYKTLLDTNALQGEATIFDLCTQDRQRVGRLIKELVDSHDRFDDLQAKLHRTDRSEKKYKQKCSDLMKKLDILDERSKRLENDKEQLKQGYLEKLTVLQHQIVCISNKLELSAQDLHTLREDNKSLNMELRSLHSEKTSMEIKYKTAEKECKTTKSLLHATLDREIRQQDFNIGPKSKTSSSQQGITRIFPIRSCSSTTNVAESSNKDVQMKAEPRFPCSSSSIPSLMEDKDNKTSNVASKKMMYKLDTVRGLQDKEAAILQDLFFLF